MKTPEQLAEEAVESVWYSFGGGFHEIKEAVVKAIEADRAQRDNDVIAKKIWTMEDLRQAWNDNFAERSPELTPEQVEEIINSAPDYLYLGALEDCFDAEWEALYDALEEARDVVLSESGVTE